MAISSRSNVKSGLVFIKNNFGGIWLMFLKVTILILPLILFVGVSVFSIIGFDVFMGSGMGGSMGSDIPSVGAIPDTSHMVGSMKMPGFMNSEMMEKLSSISTGHIFLTSLGALTGIVIIMLASTAMFVAITRSIVLDQILDTSIFSKLFDKNVLRVYYASILIYIVLGAIITGIDLLVINIHISASILGLFVIYLFLRIPLIFYGVAIGDINSIPEAFSKTKGQIWSLLKVLILGILVIIIFYIIFCLLSLGVLIIGGKVSMVLVGIVMFAGFIIMIPLQQIISVSWAYLYKSIR